MVDALTSQTSQLIITAEGEQIEVDALWQQGNPKSDGITRIAVLCHPNPLAEGTMMNKIVTTMYRFARDKGMHVVRFNFRGVGKSTGGSPQIWGDTIGEIADTMAVLDWVKSQTDARELWLGGFSFGGYIACRVAEQIEQLAGQVDSFTLTDLALIAPSIEKHEVSDLVLPTDKTFCIFGDRDELVEPSSLAAFVQKFGIRYREVEDTGHFFHGKLSELKALLGEFSS